MVTGGVEVGAAGAGAALEAPAPAVGAGRGGCPTVTGFVAPGCWGAAPGVAAGGCDAVLLVDVGCEPETADPWEGLASLKVLPPALAEVIDGCGGSGDTTTSVDEPPVGAPPGVAAPGDPASVGQSRPLMFNRGPAVVVGPRIGVPRIGVVTVFDPESATAAAGVPGSAAATPVPHAATPPSRAIPASAPIQGCHRRGSSRASTALPMAPVLPGSLASSTVAPMTAAIPSAVQTTMAATASAATVAASPSMAVRLPPSVRTTATGLGTKAARTPSPASPAANCRRVRPTPRTGIEGAIAIVNVMKRSQTSFAATVKYEVID